MLEFYVYKYICINHMYTPLVYIIIILLQYEYTYYRIITV